MNKSGNRRRVRNRGFIFGGLCLGAAMLAFPLHAEPSAGESLGLDVGTAAPRFMLPVIYGSDAKRFGPNLWTGKEAEAPKKWVLLSFFATYCEPCKKEMPELSRLYQAYREQGLGVLLVSIDREKEQADEVATLARTHDVTFPILQDRFQVVARRYAADRLPYLLMLDETGEIRKVHQGYSDEVQRALEAEVREGLGLPPLAEAPPQKSSATKRKPPSKKKSRRQRKK